MELAEDTIAYKVFPRKSRRKSKEQLVAQLSEVLNFLETLVPDYLWHKEPFNLRVHPANAKNPISFFYGETCFGDSQHDEVLIIWMLFEITRRFPFDAVLEDTQGDILLAVVACYIPEWLDPETSVNRVFVREGKLHILPKHLKKSSSVSSDSDPEEIPTVFAGLKALKPEHVCPKEVQDTIHDYLSRVATFGLDPGPNYHHAALYLPMKAAAVLERLPTIIAPAVDQFYHRDLISMKDVKKMAKFKVEREHIVPCQVRFTQILFAQITAQEFKGTKPFRSAGFTRAKNDPTREAYELGMKVTCGLEMLYQEGRRQLEKQKPGKSGKNSESNVCNKKNKKWNRYIERLHACGHFQGYIEGSKNWQERMKFAKAAFLRKFQEYSEDINGKEGVHPDSVLPRWKLRIDQVIDSLTPTMEASMKAKRLEDLRNDPPDFLTILEEDLEKMLDPYRIPHGLNAEDQKQDFELLSKIKEGIHDFLEGYSGLGGVEFSKDLQHRDEEPISTRQPTMGSSDMELLAMMDEVLSKELVGDTNTDKTMLKNILESFSSQNGNPGPVSNLLSSLRQE